MKRTILNFIIDAIAFVGFVFLTTTGVLMRYVLPPGSGHYSTIWGFDRHEWGGLHFWISVVFFSLLAVHLVLHWRWIVSVVTGRPREGSGLRVSLGIVGLLALVAFSISPLITPVEKNTKKASGSSTLSRHKYEDVQIRGSMTLLEVEKTTGVPINHIIETLKLPRFVSGEERLGVLKRTYGFEINDVREVIHEYKNKE
ncbi:MAG: DUF4405 domain-containing protein [Desulfobacterales bacterium]|nr:DUF4405 domain-containing protein [Desulfobacterales bacterium]